MASSRVNGLSLTDFVMESAGPSLEDALAKEGEGELPENDVEDDVPREAHPDGLPSEEDEDSEGTHREEDLDEASAEEEGEEDKDLEALGGPDSEAAREALLGNLQVLLERRRREEAGGGGKTDLEGLSAHERRVLRMAERAHKLEEENMGVKQWFMRGEAKAGGVASSQPVSIFRTFLCKLKGQEIIQCLPNG